MSSVFIIEEMSKKGAPAVVPRYYYGLSTHSEKEGPQTTSSIAKALAIDGANWNLAAAEQDAATLEIFTGRANRVRVIPLGPPEAPPK